MRKHGFDGTPTYRAWINMRHRCSNANCKFFDSYGGRGITVCERWSDFLNFLSDMGERPDGMSLDRIDNNGSYEPSNCRWATRSQQQRNRRVTVDITWNGTTKCVSAWADELQINLSTLRKRIRLWGIDAAFSIPINEQKRAVGIQANKTRWSNV